MTRHGRTLDELMIGLVGAHGIGHLTALAGIQQNAPREPYALIAVIDELHDRMRWATAITQPSEQSGHKGRFHNPSPGDPW